MTIFSKCTYERIRQWPVTDNGGWPHLVNESPRNKKKPGSHWETIRFILFRNDLFTRGQPPISLTGHWRILSFSQTYIQRMKWEQKIQQMFFRVSDAVYLYSRPLYSLRPSVFFTFPAALPISLVCHICRRIRIYVYFFYPVNTYLHLYDMTHDSYYLSV